MSLTDKQIQKIENYLDSKQLTYVDIRLEVLDHMVSDIENTISREHISFEAAFKKNIRKWYPQLKFNSHWITGFFYSRPEIVIQKTSKIFLKWYVILISIAILTLFIDKNDIVAFFSENLIANFNLFVTSLLIISNVFIITWYLKILTSKVKSSYLFLFEKQVFFPTIAFNFIILIFSLEGGEIITHFSLFYIPFAPILLVLGYILFKKHQRIIQKYNLAK